MKRLTAWLLRVPDKESPLSWSAFAGMLAAASPFYIAAGMDIASGLGRMSDVILFDSAILLAILIGHYWVGCLLMLLRLKAPRLLIGGAATIFVSLLFILHEGKIGWWGSATIAAIDLLLGFVLGTSIYVVIIAYKKSLRCLQKMWRIGYAVLTLLLFFGSWSWLLFDLPPVSEPDYVGEALPVSISLPLSAENPGEHGDYEYRTFTYGSGSDRGRAIFGKDVSITTPVVDGSAIIKEWDWSRKWLWGYDINHLPLNGSVWMPEGDGPFPLVLIVHGNHSMADFSDTGYAYLGEQLASRGFIAVSIDENFINHSTWEGGLDTLSEDMTIRAWLLLQHLIAIEALNDGRGNLFAGKVDMNRIAIVGHSRGGQAAALAADFDHFFAADEYQSYRVNHNFNIDVIIAVAPTDMLIYDRRLKVNNINYLLLQGSNDADVNTFSGDRFYNRIDHTDQTYRFRSSLYIKGANHGQFNTSWDRRDIGLPTQLFLNNKDLLDGEDQRTIAKVYVSAFLERLFHDDTRYEPIFKDYRYALAWLPETRYVSRYMNSNFHLLTDAEEDGSKEKARNGITLSASGMDKWLEEDLKNRRDLSQQNRIIRLGWQQSGAEYVIDFGNRESAVKWNERTVLSFSLGSFADSYPSHERVAVDLIDGSGIHARVTLNDHIPVQTPIHTRYLKSKWLEKTIRKGGLASSFEPVLQTYAIPLSEWLKEQPEINLAGIQQIRFRFEAPADGEVMLDEIGFYSTR